MSLVELDDAQDRLGTAITQDQIDEAEEQLTALIGPLTGERTETFYLSERNDWRYIDGVWLRRRTDSVVLTNDDDLLVAGTDYRLIEGTLIERIPNGASWGRTLAASYTPNDEESVRSVIYDLLAYRQTPSGVQSIRIGQYSETYFPGGSQSEFVINALLRRVLPSAELGPFASPYRIASVKRDRSVITGAGS